MDRRQSRDRGYQVEPNYRAVPFEELVAPVRFVADGIVVAGAGVVRLLLRLAAALQRSYARHQTIRELRSLPESTLKDIGLDRLSIRRAALDIERGMDPRNR